MQYLAVEDIDLLRPGAVEPFQSEVYFEVAFVVAFKALIEDVGVVVGGVLEGKYGFGLVFEVGVGVEGDRLPVVGVVGVDLGG